MPRRKTATPLLAAFGAQLRSLRKQRAMSLDKLQARTGITKGCLSTLEKGLRNLTVETCQKLAAGLGVDIMDLFSSEAVLVASRDTGLPWPQS